MNVVSIVAIKISKPINYYSKLRLAIFAMHTLYLIVWGNLNRQELQKQQTMQIRKD